ncbi:hypothetical protein [Xanthomonas translucens]|uniref:Uncharacterized protein n=1 Tax=Xanthomonas translucens pv. translucens DSM 18974 TaxID=1261556 RepID=A0A1C3TKS4_XANCT|nr:hypothetical protein [Xanthomonas translucens]MCC8446819.1 hypothetical protein [Xanthomonas translucens pv. translucens]QSQ29976.1 hypothetical protein ISN30_17365 [Xanthomonas translucens pv. translucens]UNT97652.1 hypothetical protein KBQ49_11035 [Xanthomonas translucens pv. translucens]CCP40159.1 hypothetical protein BN444_01882 [Xanthomonas translucens pv. translucens DSM 18974]SCB03847.1 Conserved hypothetical protein [Xanthomonas translucens pv. translucens DSM 18974]
MSDGTNDHCDNPDRPRTRAARDPHHDAQLLRDVALTNADVHARLGALPPGGLPVKPRRTPKLPLPSSVTAASAIYPPEDDPMKLHHLAAAAILPMAVAAAGCSKGIDVGNDGATGHLNPHPVKRYEVIATSHAPGPWDSIKAYIGYDVINAKCVPMIPFIGEQHMPNTGLDVPMARVDDHTWKGYFYRDALQDEDYFKLGVCHWDVTSVGIAAIAKDIQFNWGNGFDPILHDGLQTFYFKKSVYGDRSFVAYGAPDLSSNDPEVLQHQDAYFPVTVAVKEVKP